MRVSTPQLFNGYAGRIGQAQSAYIDAQQRVLTGKRLQLASDDPVGASVVLRSRTLRSNIEQFSSNLDFARGAVGMAESVLGEVHTLMRRGYELSLRAASDTNTPESLDALAREAEHLRDRLVELGNSRGLNGQFLFAGHKSDTQPFREDSSGLLFEGDTNPVLAEVSAGEFLRTNLENADSFFGDLYAALSELVNDIQSGNVQQISDNSVANMQAAAEDVNAVRGKIGSDLQRIEQKADEHARRTEELTTMIAEIEEVDFAQAVQAMQQAQVVYQAALTVSSQGFQLSLMDFMR